MRRVSLDIANWTVRPVGDLSAVPGAVRGAGDIAARVPGCVHTDLIRARLIRDPLVGTNEREVQWIGETDWEYRATIEADADLLAHERVDLVCEGLDTIAEIRVNGVEVGRAANMFHPHRFDLRPAVRAGENELSITFRSPLKHIRAEEARLGKRPVNGDWDPYIFIRKAACNFGWDWAPKLATCGIWKSLGIEAWNRARIERIRLLTSRSPDDSWTLNVDVDLVWSAGGPRGTIVIGAESDAEDDQDGILDSSVDSVPSGTMSLRRTLRFPQATQWCPRGFGVPRLYPLHVWVTDNYETNGFITESVDERRLKFGLRDAELKSVSDDLGTPFAMVVNGREVFCKGANWIPEGTWPAEISREKLRERLQQAAAMNINMLRVWGGGYYESDAFYEICDELGIMVWQDFMFACAMYPEEDPYPKLIEAEARHQIARLSTHPSVVLWCGGNECVWAHEAWGNAAGERPWKERLEGKTWGAGYYFDLLPRLVKELDPARPYWPNSPWPGGPMLVAHSLSIENRKSEIENVNSPNHADRHTWDLRGDAYSTIVPRFCSEFGHQSPSNYATLAKVLAPEDLKLGSPALEHRQRGTGGTKRHIDDAIAELFRPPRDFDEWHYLAQLTQARAIKTGIEWLRVNRPRCMGALIWQLNDCWPGMSWSLIDSDGRRKPAYWTAQGAFRSRLITIQPFDGQPWLCLVNDEETPARYLVELRRMGFDGTIHRAATIEAVCPGGSAAKTHNLLELLGSPTDPSRELIVAETIGRRATWFFRPDRELRYTPPTFSLQVRRRYLHEVIAVPDTLVRDFARLPRPGDRHQGWIPATILPGEEFHLEALDLQRGDELPPEPLRMKPFLCANYFGAVE